MSKIVPIKKMYEQRQHFTVIALTGISGSGCSTFANMMSKPFEQWKDDCRTIEDMNDYYISNNKREVVFAREYKTCFTYCSKQYQPFVVIEYKNVVLLHWMRDAVRNTVSYDEFINLLLRNLKFKFALSHSTKTPEPEADRYDVNNEFTKDDLLGWGITEDFYHHLSARKPEAERAAFSQFFWEELCPVSNALYENLRHRDYYCKNFFVHRLANVIRAYGDGTIDQVCIPNNVSTDHLFEVVELINDIIKGYHKQNPEKSRCFVIDSVRNSMEILYLRERYNAFYMMAIHNDGNEYELVKANVQRYVNDEAQAIKNCHNIMRLSSVEKKLDDFEGGRLFSPDLTRCVSESEIHIAFAKKEQLMTEVDGNKLSFYSYAEQWMKFYTLICHPGIITPSSDERNMSIAYVAKFNSGCISRQVGCVIVDEENAIRSVGWNDPPAPQLPCNLRYVDELIDSTRCNDANGDSNYKVYSRFEVEDEREYSKDNGGNKTVLGYGFKDCLDHEIQSDVKDSIKADGLPYSYCFRARYNKYCGNKDQVNTRALHAEENTMLRVSRNGGMGMKDGVMYVTASPCVLCSKKAYQIGIKSIVYLDPYTDIAPDLILNCGFDQPKLRPFRGAIGGAFHKLYQPFMSYKDELKIYEQYSHEEKPQE